MRWLKRDLWKAGIALATMLLLLVAIAGLPVSAADTHEELAGLAGPGTVTACSFTIDPTPSSPHCSLPGSFGANFHGTNLHGADLIRANFHQADLREANLEGTILKNTNLRGVTGLTKEQKDACKAKEAIIDED